MGLLNQPRLARTAKQGLMSPLEIQIDTMINDPLRPNLSSRLTQQDLINKGLLAIGMAPMGITKAKTAYELAHDVASKNAEKMLGLPKNNTAMQRAKALGFDLDVYHGSADISKTKEFDPSKVIDNVQYGGKFYSSVDPGYANKYTTNTLMGESPGVMPLKMKSGKRFEMDKPISSDDAANIMESLGQYERAAKIRASGKPYRSGSELFYFGLDSSLGNTQRGNAVLRSGFDSIHGDPLLEITGKAGKPHSVVDDASKLRSRFAAFDPARVNESDLLAGLAPYLGVGGLLSLGLINKNEEYKNNY